MKLTLFDAVQKWKGVEDLEEYFTSNPDIEDDELSWKHDGEKWSIQYSCIYPTEFSLLKGLKYIGEPVFISRPTPSEFRRVYKTLEKRFYSALKDES